MLCLALGLANRHCSRLILSGFDFEITHAHADNPLIAQRGAATRHADTDIEFASCVARRHGSVFTAEPIVHRRTGVPMLRELGRTDVPDDACQALAETDASAAVRDIDRTSTATVMAG
jgi:hypothetical protein